MIWFCLVNFDWLQENWRHRFIQRLIYTTQVFSKQGIEHSILIGGMPFTKPPEPVRTFCGI